MFSSAYRWKQVFLVAGFPLLAVAGENLHVFPRFLLVTFSLHLASGNIFPAHINGCLLFPRLPLFACFPARVTLYWLHDFPPLVRVRATGLALVTKFASKADWFSRAYELALQ